MLRLFIGKAGTGKTGAVIEEICRAVEAARAGRILLVPEQYSHEAERELCRRCPDSLSLYGEVLSFTGLARKTDRSQGGGAVPSLDKGGRLLCMALAVKEIGPRLKVYGAAQRRADMQDMLLSALDELKSASISGERLLDVAALCPGELGDKLRDMALVLEAYDAVVSRGRADPADRLSRLAEQIDEGPSLEDVHIYVDGFIDFTRQQQQVLRALMKKGAELTVCLTIDDMEGDSEVYELSRRAARALLRTAEELGVEKELKLFESRGRRAEALRFFADNMFSYGRESFPEPGQAIELYRAQSMSAECELAAAKAIELVRDKGCRWRDIAILVRGFEDYRGSLESVFEHYDVPLYTARRSDLLAKPLAALMDGVFQIYQSHWGVEELTDYLRTGLTGLSRSDCDLLEGYVYRWQLQAPAWERKEKWKQHPCGYGQEYDQESLDELERIDGCRRFIARPLMSYYRAAREADTASAQAMAFSQLLEDLALPQQLELRADKLKQEGREALAAEYRQLWEISTAALEQFEAILGDSSMDMEEFGKLFMLMLSKYDIGTIPVSLDSVSAGDFDRNRKRDLKHLIVLGASDQRLPRAEDSSGPFSEEERERLRALDLELSPGGDSELWREFSLIYNGLSLPGESLIMSCPLIDQEGGEISPAFVFERAKAIFGIEVKRAELSELRQNAPDPALSLAAQGLHDKDPRAVAAAEHIGRSQPERMERLRRSADMARGRLSRLGVERLYGKELRLSASRIEKFANCKFAYFCQYGLKAKPREPASFAPPEIGSFMHYVLENVARDVKERGGFKDVDKALLRSLCDKYIEDFIHTELNDMQEKTQRFSYLFRRLKRDVYKIVEDMAEELSRSDFEPLDFELDMSRMEDIAPLELDEGSLRLTGIADRVDGWYHEGKLYLRVVDYKTGKKKFSLSDVWYGMGLQMLLYLFTLAGQGESRYRAQILPAGVMYIPARNSLVSMSRAPSSDEAEEKRLAEIRRSGLVLDDEALIQAWEHGAEKKYIPVRFRSGKPSQDALASLERLGQLEKHIKKTLSSMAGELKGGSIAADPYYRSQQENACVNCDYFEACHFAEGQAGESSRYMPKLSPQKVWELVEGEMSHD